MGEIMILQAICLCLMSPAGAGTEAQRDPWTWPFAVDSIWNTPIGSEARFVPARLNGAPHIGLDVEYLVVTKSTDPVEPVFPPSSWNKRWPGDTKRKLGELHVPAALVIPDAKEGSTPNGCSAFLMPDGRTVKQLEPTCRLAEGGHLVGWLREDQDIFGPGIYGTHWGSGLSTLGGSIRKGELVGNRPIRHAIKLNVWGDQLYYGADVKGFRWPADRSDSGAPSGYHGKNPKLVMGALLALQPNLTTASLGIRSELGKKLFHVLQDYGAYISDDSGWDHYDLCAEVGVQEEVQQKYGTPIGFNSGSYRDELMSMITNLAIVDNNSVVSVGGGGIRRMPLAPPFLKIGK